MGLQYRVGIGEALGVESSGCPKEKIHCGNNEASAHFGAFRVASKTAVCSPPPPDEFTVREIAVLWLSEPEVRVTVTLVVPAGWFVRLTVTNAVLGTARFY